MAGRCLAGKVYWLVVYKSKGEFQTSAGGGLKASYFNVVIRSISAK